jgi:hypothetical protein
MYMIENEDNYQKELRRLTTPRAATVASVLFSLLFAASLVLIRTSIPETLSTGTEWVVTGSRRITVALFLMPFAGIAFLWFIGVVRDQLGEYEDKFFATVFFGSGLLFLSMVFVSMAIAGSILAVAQSGYAETPTDEIVYFARALMFNISNIYALRMAGVFMISLGTIWWRTGLMPRWLAMISFLLALSLLLVINLSLWVSLIFPIWVFMVSVVQLVPNEQTRT